MSPRNPDALVLHESDGVTICDYVDTQVVRLNEIREANDRRYEQRFIAQEQSVTKSDRALEVWQKNANEWRGAMTDREAKFLGVDVYRTQHEGLCERVRKLEVANDRAAGRASIATFVSIAAVIIALLKAVGVIR